MADIDKSLPNVKRPEEEVAEEFDVAEIEETSKGPVEVTEDEEGATIDFDPSAMQMPDGGDPFANLNELLPEEDTDLIGSQLQQEQIYGKEQTYGTQGNFFGEQINKKPMYDYAEGGITRLRSKYEYKK